MSCPQVTLSLFTVLSALVWNNENSHIFAKAVHCPEKHCFAKWFRSAVKKFAVSTAIDFRCRKTGLLSDPKSYKGWFTVKCYVHTYRARRREFNPAIPPVRTYTVKRRKTHLYSGGLRLQFPWSPKLCAPQSSWFYWCVPDCSDLNLLPHCR